MPLQNRVTPTGEIVADPGRGLLMGNRGCLHDPARTLGVTRWRSKLWICCLLVWKDVRRDPMPPGRWTALFFLDEVTALAAGHRPCAYCRRPDYLAFAEAWRAAGGSAPPPPGPREGPPPAPAGDPAGVHRRLAGRGDGPIPRQRRPARRRALAAVVFPGVRRPDGPTARRARRAAHPTGDRRRDRGRLPATGASERDR